MTSIAARFRPAFGLLATAVSGALAGRRAGPRQADAHGTTVGADKEHAALRAGHEAFDHALIVMQGDCGDLLAGEGALAACAEALRATNGDTQAVLEALGRQDPAAGASLHALSERGEPFDAVVRSPDGAVRLRGRTAGALALLLMWREPGAAAAEDPRLEGLRSFLGAHSEPAFILDREGQPAFVNPSWLRAAGASDLAEAEARGLEPDRAGRGLAAQAQAAGQPLERVRWTGSSSTRRALRTRAVPLAGGETAVWSWDVTAAHSATEASARQDEALSRILDEVTDAVAVFGEDQRLTYHNPAFARLWDLEPAWLAAAPSHGALLDRLRQAGRLPEVADYASFRSKELARHQRVGPAPEAIWRMAGARLVRVQGLPHPAGGLILLFADVTSEVRLKSQFNHLIQVQQATLDKLTDAVAVFGPDARLKLHNDAFARLWGLSPEALNGEPAFDVVVERCVARLHDMHFWNELKGRITDPDPAVRAAMEGEVSAEGRRLSWQSRPLPDGATLLSFADVTDTRRLERALNDREQALNAVEQVKRDFISSVSYELRTPLTTILGYAELLERGEKSLSGPGRAWIRAVREAAADLARSVEDILAFAELDAGEMSLDLGKVDVAAFLQGAVTRWRDRAAEASIGLELDIGEAAGEIEADARELARVLDQLIERAVRETPAGGRILLRARRAAGEICLEVIDDGRGVPFHIQAHIFDRFGGEEGSGAGLGMALVKAIVELHGGWVALESEPGAGAVFACHLPDGRPPQMDAEPAPA